MSDTRAPRPTDLVALVTFDEEVSENQAVPRERLGQSNESPRPLAVAIEQWLHLGRRTWISVAGREIRGIATARDLATRTAWEIDTLIEAPSAGDQVICDLLRQAASAAADAQATHLLLRTPVDSVAAQEAPRAGFRLVMNERIWSGALVPLPHGDALTVRRAEDADLAGRFQLYCRAMPATAREGMAMTIEEWESVRELRWRDRGLEMVAEREGRIVGSLPIAKSGQFALSVDPDCPEAGDALLASLAEATGAADHFALLLSGSAAEDAARRAGMTAGQEYSLFCLRIAKPVRDEAFARARIAIPG